MKKSSLYYPNNHSNRPVKISTIHHQSSKGILFSQPNNYNSNALLEQTRQTFHRSLDQEEISLSAAQDKKQKTLKDPNNNKLATIFQIPRVKRFISLPQPSKCLFAEGKMLHTLPNQTKYTLKSPSSMIDQKNLPLEDIHQAQDIQGKGITVMKMMEKTPSSSKIQFFPQTKTPANKPEFNDFHSSQSNSFEKRTKLMNLTKSTMINHKTESSPFEDKLFSPPSTSTNFQSFDSHEEARKMAANMPKKRAVPSWNNIPNNINNNGLNHKPKQDNNINEIFPRSPQVLPAKYFSAANKLSQLPLSFVTQSIERVPQKSKQQFASTQDIRSYAVTKETQASESTSSNKIVQYSNREVLEDLRDIQSRFYELKGLIFQSITSNGNWFVQKLEDIASGNQQINIKAFGNFIIEISRQALYSCTKSLVKLEKQTPNNSNNAFSLSFKLNEVINSRLTKIFIESLRAVGCTASSSASYNIILNYFENECKKHCVNNSNLTIQISTKLQQQILDNCLANLLKQDIGIDGTQLKRYYQEIQDFWEGLLQNNEQSLMQIIRSNSNLIKQNLTPTLFFFMKYSLMIALCTERQLNKSTRGKIIKQFEKIRAILFPDLLFATNLTISQFKQELLKHPKISQTFEDPHKDNNYTEEAGSFSAKQIGSLNNSTIEGMVENNTSRNQKNLNSSSLSFHQQNMSLSKIVIPNRTNPSYLQNISSQMIQALTGRKKISILISYLERYSNPANSQTALKEIAEIMKESMIQSISRTSDGSFELQQKDLEFKMTFFQHINDLEILEDSFSEVFQFIQLFKKWIADKLSIEIISSQRQDNDKDQMAFREDSLYYRFLEYLIFSLASKEEIFSVYDIDAARRVFQIEPKPFKLLLSELAFFLSQNNFPKQPIRLLIVYIQKMSLVL